MSVSRRYVLLFGLFLLALAAWTAWWFYLAGQVKERTLAWVAEQRASGTEISYQDFTVSGYPYRIEVDLDKLALAVPQAPEAPEVAIPHLKVLGLPWNPRLVLADVVGPVTLAWTDPDSRRQTALYDAKSTTISIGLEAGRLARLSASAQYPRLSAATLGGLLSAKLFEIHARDLGGATALPPAEGGSPTAPLAGQVAVDGDTIALPGTLESPMGAQIASLGLTLGLTGPLTAAADPRAILAAWRDAGGTLEIERGDLRWGSLDLSLTGTLALDKAFRPQGALSGRVGGLDPVLAAAVSQGRLAADQAESIRSALGALSFLTRDEAGRVPFGITLQDGRVLVGPVAVGRVAPIL